MNDKEFSDTEKTYLSLLIQIASSDFYRKNFGLQMPVYNQIELDEPSLQVEELPSDADKEPEDTPSDTEEDTRDQIITKLKSELKQAKSLWVDSDHMYTELLGKYYGFYPYVLNCLLLQRPYMIQLFRRILTLKHEWFFTEYHSFDII